VLQALVDPVALVAFARQKGYAQQASMELD
jgi:hypothetical protein